MQACLGRFVRHLRLQFQFILAPIFLLGYDLTGAPLTWSFLPLFLLIHVGLYGGATAYNSYYDRDKGPIGGMKQPLAVDAAELYGGLLLQALALLGLLWWGLRMFLGGLAMGGLGILYSHPHWRWKARPVLSLLAVSLGQGLFLSIIWVWSRRFADQTVYQNHDWSFGISFGMSGMFWVLLFVEFLRQSIA
jgi:hypothetical protein